MKKIAFAVLVATLAGCAIVPYGPPPVYVHVRGDYDHGHGGWRY